MTTNKHSGAPSEIAAQKSIIRSQISAKRRALPPEQLKDLSLCAQHHILTLPAWHTARQVLLYSAVNGELDTSILLENAMLNGKSVLLPRCIPEIKGCMEFAPCKNKQDLRPGPFGILEPNPENCPAVESQNLTPQIAIIPGIAFTCEGLRLGYGGGYYDRFLAGGLLGDCLLVGFCANFQIIDYFPEENWDYKMDAICTEKGLTFCS